MDKSKVPRDLGPPLSGHRARSAKRRVAGVTLCIAASLLVTAVHPEEAIGRGTHLDPILFWNDVALEANRVSHTNGRGEQTGPPLSARALSIVRLAAYDAFAGAWGNPPHLRPYLPGLPSHPVGVSVNASVAGAGHTTLSALFPSQRAFFDAKLRSAPQTGTEAQRAASREYGAAVARALLVDQSGDPGVDDAGYAPSTAPGHHQPDPDNPGQGFHAPFYGRDARVFAVSKRYALDPPPLPGDKAYRSAFKEVRVKGIAPELVGSIASAGPKRTPDETLIGLFWAYDGAKGIGTPPRLYNQIIRAIAIARGDDAASNALRFALVNVAMADAGILAWEQKYLYDVWRPIVGIREDPTSEGPGGPSSDRDAGWRPLGAPRTNEPDGGNFTPPFPAYPSGHATFGAAAFQIVRLFYGVTADGPDRLNEGLRFGSDELNGVSTDNQGKVRPIHVVRSFPDGRWGMIKENSLSRVFLGVHWVTDGFAPGPGGRMDLEGLMRPPEGTRAPATTVLEAVPSLERLVIPIVRSGHLGVKSEPHPFVAVRRSGGGST